MNKTTEAELTAKAELFKALGHPVRLLILNLVRLRPRHGEELAAILNLNPATISHHLALLTQAGLLISRKDQYYQTFSLASGALEQTLAEIVRLSPTDSTLGVEEDAYRNKVLQTFFRRGRLTGIPAQLKKRQIILEKIAQEFEPEREYSEREVNLILLDFHDDVASLRRGLVENRLLARQEGIYRRILSTPKGDELK
jgi:hypothetical protein